MRCGGAAGQAVGRTLTRDGHCSVAFLHTTLRMRKHVSSLLVLNAKSTIMKMHLR